MGPYAIGLDDVRRAVGKPSGHVLRTPLVPAPRLSELAGASVLVKHENMQATGSFKERGAVDKLANLDAGGAGARRRRHVGRQPRAGGRLSCGALGVPATIVMPVGTPLVKVENRGRYGARVVLHGETLSEPPKVRGDLRPRRTGVRPPLRRSARHGGPGHRRARDARRRAGLDQIVVPIGGGGLVSGIAVAAKALKPGSR